MVRILSIVLTLCLGAMSLSAKTLVVYYSFTNNVGKIVAELRKQIDCVVVEIEPAEKGLDYAANGYAIGSAQIAAIRNNPYDASSYPAIDSVDVDLDEYDTIIIGAPLWWSQMAAPMQTYLFLNGSKMAGKKIGLIVSSHSSGIGGVEADARRLIPGGDFLEPSLWIRSADVSNCSVKISGWLEDIDYGNLTAGNAPVVAPAPTAMTVYSLNGTKVAAGSLNDLSGMARGVYIIKGPAEGPRKIILP